MKSVKRRLLRRAVFGIVSGVCGLLGVFNSRALAQTYLFNRANFPVDQCASSVVVADFNGDGKPDLAVRSAAAVSVLLGKPDGTFAPKIDTAVSSAVGGWFQPLAAGDFNGDGKADMVLVNSGSTISVLLGVGDGTFQSPTDFAVGNFPVSVAVGDFNGDGKLDLAVINANDSTVSILLGDGKGSFISKGTFLTGLGPTSVAVGDFNGDGEQDLAVANSNCSPSSGVTCGAAGTVSILLGNGDGTFQPRVDFAEGPGPLAIAAADFNGDGKPDLAVANAGDGSVVIFLGKGDGSFQMQSSYPIGGPALGQQSFLALAVGDFNDDGKLDVTAAGMYQVNITGVWMPVGFLSSLLGQGDGTFLGPFTSGEGEATSVAVGDFNGDGRLDLAVALYGGTISIHLGTGSGSFGPSITEVSPLVAGDFNGDGKLDFANDAGELTVPSVAITLGNGDGTFLAPVSYPSGVAPGSLAVGDFNGDGKLDLAVADNGVVSSSPPYNTATQTIAILPGNGDGSLGAPVQYKACPSGYQLSGLSSGDFNGDGKADLAVFCNLPTFLIGTLLLSILYGNGDGSFQPPVQHSVFCYYACGFAAGDFNHDGIVDLALSEDGTVAVYLSGTGGTSYSGFGGPFVAGDFKGDGNLDLVVGMMVTEGTGAVLLNRGDGIFTPGYTLFGGEATLAADLNGDGKLDLAGGGNARFGDFGGNVWLGNGDGTFQDPVNTGLTFIAGVGDFNGDGALDLFAKEGILLNEPVIALFPSHISFGSQAVGITSATETVQVSNPGSMPLKISSITASGDFAIASNSCGAVLASGANCQVGVTFTPSSTGTNGGTITLTDSAPSSPQVIALVGTGVNEPLVSLSPPSLSFGGQPVGTISAPQTMNLTNTGSAALAISTISTSLTSFSQTNTCGASLAVGASCTITVTFTPSSAGTVAGSLVITDNASDSPQTVSLSGTGIGPAVSLSATSLSFGGQPVGAASSAQPVTLTNNGTAVLNITGIAVSGDFAQSNTCGSSLATGASCSINVTFTPSTTGTRTGTLTISDDATDSPHAVALAGTGVGPLVSLSPASLAFPAQFVGTSGLPQNVTVTNTGNASLTITSVQATTDFAATSGCTSTVAAGVSCTIGVFFDPSAAGARTGTLAITDNAPGSPHTVALSGTGQDFELAAGSATPAVITAGQSAGFIVKVSPAGGFAQAVALSCSGAPQAATCTVSPASVTLNGSTATNANVTVSTTARSGMMPRPCTRPPAGSHPSADGPLLVLWLLAVAAGLSRHGVAALSRLYSRAGWKPAPTIMFAAMLLLVFLAWAACGGGGGMGGGGGGHPGTPAGSYTLTVTATFTSGSTTLQHTQTLPLTVN